ncbi:MAG: SpoVR family protein [Pseudomonadota bacterium]
MIRPRSSRYSTSSSRKIGNAHERQRRHQRPDRDQAAVRRRGLGRRDDQARLRGDRGHRARRARASTSIRNQIEIITSEQMLDAYASIGLPIMYRHWSFGKRFVRDEILYRKGFRGWLTRS